MLDDAARWDARYRSAAVSRPTAPEGLRGSTDLLDLIPTSGTAIDIACGAGAQSLWLATHGLHVTALDVSPVAIDLLVEAAAASGLGSRVDARVTDLDDGLPADPGAVDVVVCQRFRQPALYADIVERLRPGGLAIVTVLSVVGTDTPGPFHAPPGELVLAFADLELLHHAEGDGVATIVGRRAATVRRPSTAPHATTRDRSTPASSSP
jgi:SAM-dependent methyltransferase